MCNVGENLLCWGNLWYAYGMNVDDFLNHLLKWYRQNARSLPWRGTDNPYFVLVSEIMLQQTRIATVYKYFENFIKLFPSVESLAKASEQVVLKAWEGLGYYRRAKNLQAAARQIVQQYGGKFPQTYEELLHLQGVGEYTAGAIASICFGLPTPAIDGNVIRVVSRYTAVPLTNNSKDKKSIGRFLLPMYQKIENCGELTQSIMELGEIICTPRNTQCNDCPLQQSCGAKAKNLVDILPIPGKKIAQPTSLLTVIVLICGDCVAFCKRPNSGLLASLYQFPNVEKKLSLQETLSWIQTLGYSPIQTMYTNTHTHIFTHRIWEMTAFFVEIESKDIAKKTDDFVWDSIQNIRSHIPLPSAFAWVLDYFYTEKSK